MTNLVSVCTLGVVLFICAPVPRAETARQEPSYLIILGEPDTFSSEFRPRSLRSPRQVGFGVKVRMLEGPIDALTRQVETALDTAERTGYPVLITLDDWNFTQPCIDPEVVEWSDWPAPGASHGPLVKRRWINWGSWVHMEAPPNFESKKFRDDVQQRLEEGVLPPIVTRLTKWVSEGRDQLFAGLVIGWESGFYTFFDFDPENPPKGEGLTFSPDEVLGTGYAALTARGYTAEKVRAMADDRACSERAIVKELMADVVHDYVGFLALTCNRAGIPRERLYSHYSAMASHAPSFVEQLGLHEDGRVLPVEGAVQEFCRPGLTVSEPWCNLEAAAKTLREHGEPAWDAVEMEFTDSTRHEDDALRYLERLSREGARVICIYGWWCEEGSIFQVQKTGAVPAMKRWLQAQEVAATEPVRPH